MNKRIIGLAGKKGHGKDTAAKVFHQLFDNNTCILSFAHPLKVAVGSLFNLTEKMLEDRTFKETPLKEWDNKTPRQLLQWMGTDVLRNQFDKDIFLKNMEQKINGHLDFYDNIIISDVRFDNEAQMIQHLGGCVIQIDATERLGVGNDTHPTENGISENLKDMVIYNNSNEEHLITEINTVITQLDIDNLNN